MKLKYFFFCILAAASLTASPEIALAHGGGGGHGFGGGGGGHAFVGGGDHGFGGSTGRGFRPGLSGTRGYSSGRDDHGRFGDRGFRGRIATFAVVVFAILTGTSSILASIGSDIPIITSITIRITTHTPISNDGAY